MGSGSLSDARVSTRKTIAPASVRTGLGADAVRELFQPLVESLLTRDDYMLLADYHEGVECQEPVSQAYADRNAWTRMSVLNCARIGRFSSDRAIREYCREIWKVTPIAFDGRRAGCGP
jgi:glycogen phosphorylase